MGKIAIYYKYVTLPDPAAVRLWQIALCKSLGLTGRIIIAEEGINGTVGGSDEAIKAYVKTMKEYEPFKGIDYKYSDGDASCFPKIKVSLRNEIVRLGVSPSEVTVKDGGKHLSPDQVQQLLEKKPDDLVILDTRNKCEWEIGAFEGAIKPELVHFRELPEYIENNIDQFKDKQVLMYCTAGVRCERATAFLKQKNVAKEVYQIKGGIQRYVEKYPDGFFRGKNYVFDGRIAVKVNDDILGKCHLCTTSCDEYTNCLNALCNLHFIGCPACLSKYKNCCSKKCQKLVTQKQTTIRPTLRKK